MDKTQIWNNYINNKTAENRNAIVEVYVYLVKRVIYTIPCTRIGLIEEDDLYSEGVIGLIDAVEKFDPSKNVKFESYACLRIKGQILDYMRKLDILSRDARKKAKELNDFINRYHNIYGKEPSLQEIATALRTSVDKVKRIQEEEALSDMISFETFVEDNGDIIKSRKEEEYPEETFDKAQLSEALAYHIERLTEKEKTILNLYYYEELTYKEIAEIMDLCESRISQIISGILAQLKEKLKDNI
ncbi:MAG: FliA/WhiG family RNA polymerase sigma factor [Clostridia bacterium]|jgi:RNA polymerase sigma factor for flagellar operon FliA